MSQQIRNFCIIAHIDHGKSTLADRMLEMTETIRKSNKQQVLDRMDLEQERGITIKLTPARMKWKDIELNLIDTPGHVDFQYEVSRSLAAVEGAILLVDASQGIQAQTLSTLYQALDQNLEIIPVLNKIDLPAANPDRVGQEIENIVGIDQAEIIKISAKTGDGIPDVLDAIIERIDNPETFKSKNIKKFSKENIENQNINRALIFDSVYDPYKGVLSYIKVIDGQLKPGEPLHLVHSQTSMTPPEVGFFTPDYHTDTSLTAGQIGYIVTGKKSVRDAQIGDTIVGGIKIKDDWHKIKPYAIPGFKYAKPFVYAGVYPLDTSDYDKLKDALEKLALNDSAIEYDMEDSKALGLGFRCGFLGMLHMEIIKERLRREYKMETIFTIPTAVYLVKSKQLNLNRLADKTNVNILIDAGLWKHILHIEGIENITPGLNKQQIVEEYGDVLHPRLMVKSGTDMIEQGMADAIYEPIANVEIVGPEEFAGNVMPLCQEYRGNMKHMEYIDEQRVVRQYEMPMGEILIDFYDRLKSATKGFATMNYEFVKYEANDLVKLDVLVNNERVEALSRIVHRNNAYHAGRDAAEKLKELIPRHMFPVPIQAGIGNKIIARETIPALKKDVIAKCYGGDVSRKRKLLQKQKEGKKRMKALGNVQVPGDVFVKMVTRG